MITLPYKKILAHFPKEEQKEIMRGFYQKHRDVRDTVQIPKVFAFFSAMIIQSVIFAYWTGMKASVTIIPFVIMYFCLSKSVLDMVFKKRNQLKLEQFINQKEAN